MIITVKHLRELNMCKPECTRFEKLYPEGLELTWDNMLQVLNQNFDVFYFGANFIYAKNKISDNTYYGHIVDEMVLVDNKAEKVFVYMDYLVRKQFTISGGYTPETDYFRGRYIRRIHEVQALMKLRILYGAMLRGATE